MWTRVARFILRNRVLLIVLITLFTGFMAYMGRNVKMSYEYARLLPEDDINYKNHQQFKKLFGEEANIFVVGFQDSSFFKVNKFNDLLKLTRDVKKIPGVKEVVSAAQLVSLEKNTVKKKFEVKHIFPDTITSQKQLDSLIQVVYRGKRKQPWLWLFSPRPLEQLIYNKNPNSKISYQKTIKLSK